MSCSHNKRYGPVSKQPCSHCGKIKRITQECNSLKCIARREGLEVKNMVKAAMKGLKASPKDNRPTIKSLTAQLGEAQLTIEDYRRLVVEDMVKESTFNAQLAEKDKRIEELVALVHDAKFSKSDKVQVLRINNELALILNIKELVATSIKEIAALKGTPK